MQLKQTERNGWYAPQALRFAKCWREHLQSHMWEWRAI